LGLRTLERGSGQAGPVATLTRRAQEYRGRPEVTVRSFAATDLPDLLARHAELFERLELPEG
jgi:hypothetical protein